jgi:hypothetical protein
MAAGLHTSIGFVDVLVPVPAVLCSAMRCDSTSFVGESFLDIYIYIYQSQDRRRKKFCDFDVYEDRGERNHGRRIS